MNIQRYSETHSLEQFSLGRLIDELKSIRATDECSVVFDFGNYQPTDFDSWRGSYDELCLRYDDHGANNVSALDALIQNAETAVDSSFYGYKGGNYIMTRETPVWIANHGDAGHTFLVAVTEHFHDMDGLTCSVVLETAYGEF